jgi:hypothetical protein
MGKVLVAFILITDLLLCPFCCMSGERDVDVAADKHAARSGCSCCLPKEACDDSPSKGNDKSNDRTCPNCICEGATLKDGPDDSIADALLFTFTRWLVPGDTSNQFSATTQIAHCADRPAHSISGHAALIAFQIWLI